MKISLLSTARLTPLTNCRLHYKVLFYMATRLLYTFGTNEDQERNEKWEINDKSTNELGILIKVWETACIQNSSSEVPKNYCIIE